MERRNSRAIIIRSRQGIPIRILPAPAGARKGFAAFLSEDKTQKLSHQAYRFEDQGQFGMQPLALTFFENAFENMMNIK